jgi:hypothetical protein
MTARIAQAGLVLLILLAFTPFLIAIPFADEWQRLHRLNPMTVADWIAFHSNAWVVRPFADFWHATMAWPLTNGQSLLLRHPYEFLDTYQLSLIFSFVTLLGLMWAAGSVLAARTQLPSSGLWLALALVVCWMLVSDGIGLSFYWTDGYGNVLLPGAIFLLGCALFLWSSSTARIAGVAFLLIAGLAHEIFSIAGLGLLVVTASLKWRELGRVGAGAFMAGSALISVLLYAQLFAAGPAARRHHYEARGNDYVTGFMSGFARNDITSCLLAVAAGAFLGAAIILASRERQALITRIKAHRLYWMLAGTGFAAYSLLVLSFVGASKLGNFNLSYYPTLRSFFLMSGAGLLASVAAAHLPSGLLSFSERSWRKPALSAGALIIGFSILVLTPNFEHIRTVANNYAELRTQALDYVDGFSERRGQSIRVCRPNHDFFNTISMLTRREASLFLGLPQLAVKESVCGVQTTPP